MNPMFLNQKIGRWFFPEVPDKGLHSLRMPIRKPKRNCTTPNAKACNNGGKIYERSKIRVERVMHAIDAVENIFRLLMIV